jgi:sugar phosphate isomerase/epimerase
VNLDIQGVELKALKGMGDYLKDVQYIYTEVNSDYVYKNCSIVGEIDDFLKQYGFSRVETSWFRDCRWGDAFYMKSK